MTEAERLANQLEIAVNQESPEDDVIMVTRWFIEDSFAELRRLDAINAELVEACEAAVLNEGGYYAWKNQISQALKKAKQ